MSCGPVVAVHPFGRVVITLSLALAAFAVAFPFIFEHVPAQLPVRMLRPFHAQPPVRVLVHRPRLSVQAERLLG